MKKIILSCIAATMLAACNSNKSEYDAEGFFESTEITVSAEATGNILDLNIHEGESINAFESVGHIDSIQLYLNKLQLEKNAQSINSNRPDTRKQISVLESQIRKCQKEQTRIENMLRDGAATQKQLDDITAQLELLNSQLDAQKSSLENSISSLDAQALAVEVQIELINDKLAKCNIQSPISGTVLAKYAHAGEFTAIGKPLFKVADLNNLYLRAYVTSAQLSSIKLGDKVSVFADFGGDNVHQYEGTIDWIASKSEFTPKNIQTQDERQNLVYAIKVAVKNDGYIKLGMYGGIKLRIES